MVADPVEDRRALGVAMHPARDVAAPVGEAGASREDEGLVVAPPVPLGHGERLVVGRGRRGGVPEALQRAAEVAEAQHFGAQVSCLPQRGDALACVLRVGLRAATLAFEEPQQEEAPPGTGVVVRQPGHQQRLLEVRRALRRLAGDAQRAPELGQRPRPGVVGERPRVRGGLVEQADRAGEVAGSCADDAFDEVALLRSQRTEQRLDLARGELRGQDLHAHGRGT